MSGPGIGFWLLSPGAGPDVDGRVWSGVDWVWSGSDLVQIWVLGPGIGSRVPGPGVGPDIAGSGLVQVWSGPGPGVE